MREIHRLAERGRLAPIDVELAGLLARRAAASLSDVGEVRVVALAGALLSLERAHGHSCLDLAALAGTAPFPEAASTTLPSLDACRAILARSRLCVDAEAMARSEPAMGPLVLEGDRLYLWRYHAAERRLAAAVRARLAPVNDAPELDAATVALFRRLFAVGDGAPIDWQAVAAAAGLRNRITIVTGGPGTGKTTTVARLLALLLQREPDLRVAVAAPTGKAAARLAEAIAAGAAAMPIDDALRGRLPRDGRTLHRLLGYQPWNDRFAHGPERPLAEDVIVVDEASMVDLLMMDALFAALRPTTRVVLLGDPDQLASVDTGHVLGDLCRAADRRGADHGAALGAWYAALSGQALATSENATPLRDAVVRLRRSYRFERQPGIGAVAEAVRVGDATGALAALDDDLLAEVRWRAPVRAASELLVSIAPLVESYLEAETPAEALERLAAFRVLCAVREGRTGVAGLNEGVERWIGARGVPTRARWYDRRPVLVTANDPATALWNGDVGVVFTEHGRTSVHFADGAAGTRAIAPARLPAHETAWAMTVHKAQGSEFDHVLLVLPDEDSRVLTRELLYTGVTRARRRLDVVGRREMIALTTGRVTARASGLEGRL